MALVTIESHGDGLLVWEPFGTRAEFIFAVTERTEDAKLEAEIAITRTQVWDMAVTLLAWLDDTEQNPVVAAAAHEEVTL